MSTDTPHARHQCEHILDAARQCFIEQGFEAASMSRIATCARVSTGLPYHYFKNKRAIVLALISRQLAQGQAELAELPISPGPAQALTQAFSMWSSGDREGTLHAGLHAEITALGTRDRQVAERLSEADQEGRDAIARWLDRTAATHGTTLHDQALPARALMFQILIDGLAVRAAREPGLDTGLLLDALDQMMDAILAPTNT